MAHLLIYGGTFDPIHHGHLLPCRAARELLAADRVLLIPAWVSPHKKDGPPTATSQQRLAMARLAVEGQPDFAVDDREVRRGEAGGVSFTFDTVQEIRREHPADTCTLLLGEDQLAKFHLWHRVQELVTQMPIAVMTRGSSGGTGMNTVREHLGQLSANLRLLPTPRIDIAATDIRHRLRASLPISYLLPPAVEAYIREEKLYI